LRLTLVLVLGGLALAVKGEKFGQVAERGRYCRSPATSRLLPTGCEFVKFARGEAPTVKVPMSCFKLVCFFGI